MTIDAYLAALERLLPRSARLRAVAEVREHLRDSAAAQRESGLSAAEAEIAATTAFGAVEEVAARLSSELAVRETRFASVLALLATAFFVFPLYVVPENTLPPAPWADKPAEIALLQQLAIGLWIAACALAAAGVAIAWSRSARLARLAVLGAAVAVAGSTAATAVLVERWFAHTSATPNWALAAPLAAACVAACIGAAAWTRSLNSRLVQD